MFSERLWVLPWGKMSVKAVWGVMLVALLLASCGRSSTEDSRPTPSANQDQPALQSPEVTIRITATNSLQFDGQTPGPVMKVPLGATVRIIFTNSDAVLHDWWVAEANEQAPYLVPAFKRARTKVIGGGEKTETSFVADRPGMFKYVCTVPGHDKTMFGPFIVEGNP